MDVQVHGKLNGSITAPPSKSQAHRLIIAAFLSGEKCTVNNVSYSDDIKATIDCCRKLGADAQCLENSVVFHGYNKNETTLLDCHESGSTLRFMLPIAAALGGNHKFTGRGRLPQRPIDEVVSMLSKHGVNSDSLRLPLTLSGQLTGGEYLVDPSRSSQPLTGLLYALPLLEKDSKITLLGEIQSKPYIDITMQVLERFGIKIEETNSGYSIKGGQKYQPVDTSVEGDWSNATFWLVAGAVGGTLTCSGLDIASKHGDKAVVEILKQMGHSVTIQNDKFTVSTGSGDGVMIDASHIPDSIPALAVAAACGKGKTVVYNGERLRIKESDRISSVVQNLKNIGANVEETADGMIIHGGAQLTGGTVDCCNDHRIAMAFSVASLRCTNPVTLIGAECVKKSYPDFFEVFKNAGGSVNVINMG